MDLGRIPLPFGAEPLEDVLDDGVIADIGAGIGESRCLGPCRVRRERGLQMRAVSADVPS